MMHHFVFQKFAEDYKEAYFAKVNVDENAVC